MPPRTSVATHVACPPGQPEFVEIVCHLSSLRRARKPFSVTAQSVPLLSSQTDWTDSKGKPLCVVSKWMAHGRKRFNPPPCVPTQMLPSLSSSKLEISGCDTGIFSKAEPSKRNSPL